MNKLFLLIFLILLSVDVYALPVMTVKGSIGKETETFINTEANIDDIPESTTSQTAEQRFVLFAFVLLLILLAFDIILAIIFIIRL